jgi:leucyl aminopeptidase
MQVRLLALALAFAPGMSPATDILVSHATPDGSGVVLERMTPNAIDALSARLHRDTGHCGGLVQHPNEADFHQWTAKLTAPRSLQAITRKIDDAANVGAVMARLDPGRLLAMVEELSTSTPNRHYRSEAGVAASHAIAAQWRSIAGSRDDITVSTLRLPQAPQSTVIARIEGSERPGEIIVIGSHLDSISPAARNDPRGLAPGADDDASGVATATEVLRAMVESGYRSKRSIHFVAHAGEEAGLLGSRQVAADYRRRGANVVGMMQLDMTANQGSADDIYLMTDYTDAGQNDFVAELARTYLPTLRIGRDRCGYGCSDHASWFAEGYPTSMPFESGMRDANPAIHTTRDTVESFGGHANHAIKFARLATAFAVELAND